MIKKLRYKFILINLLLVGLILLVVFSIFVASNAHQLAGQSYASMRLALQWHDNARPPRFEIGTPPTTSTQQNRDGKQFTFIPVFAVTVSSDGSTEVNDGGQVEVSAAVAAQAAEEALATGSREGVLPSLQLRFLVEQSTDNTTRIAFADRSWELDSLLRLVVTSLLIWLAAMAGFFFLSLFLSALALRPVAQAWTQQRQFVADASHELKTPLTVILANTGIVLSHRAEPIETQAKWVEYIQDEAKRMRELVDALLFLAKSDDSRHTTPFRTVYMSDLAMGCLLPFESVAFEVGVTLESDITPDLTLMGDEGQLRRLILILLDNAVKYAGGGGVVTLSLTRQQERLRLAVHNTGSPIPPEHLPHLFERFYRVDASRDRSQGGYGLGLAIAASIAAHHDSSISVTSTEELGTRFAVLFPRRH